MQMVVLTCEQGNHMWRRPAQKGRRPHNCPEHQPEKPKQAPKQRLTCQSCGGPWTRTAIQGPRPRYCPSCTSWVKEAESKQEEPKRRHKAFPTLLATAQAGVPVMLVGPAGSGKSTAGRQVAEEMGLSFRSESCNPMMTKWDLFGFVGPNGNYVPGVIREAFENGGVVLLDEMDASNPAVLVSINLLASVEAGETVTFPDGKNVPRHENFVLIAGANTFGDGASAEYVGREQLDAATLDRFAMVEWSYDEALERKAAGEDQAAWVVCVQDVRAAAERASVSLLVTPRASINGAKLIRKGMDRETVANLVLWKGVSTDEKRSILAQM